MKELLCYSYTIKRKDSDYCFGGWIEGLSLSDAETNLKKQEPKLSEIVKLIENGTWEDFINTGNKYGWD